MGSTHIAPPQAVGQHILVLPQDTLGPQDASHISTDSVGGHDPGAPLTSKNAGNTKEIDILFY